MGRIPKVKSDSKKSWASISKLRKSIDVVFDGETLFSIQEMEPKDFNVLIETWIANVEDQETVFDNNEILAYSLRNTVKGVALDGLSDEDIISTFNDMSDEIKIQVNEAFEELITKRIQIRIESFTKLIDTLKGVDQEQAEKIIQKLNKKVV
jgi:hypothetical protein